MPFFKIPLKAKKQKIKFRAFFGGTKAEKRKFNIESQKETVKLIKGDLRSLFVRLNPAARREGMRELRKEESILRRLIGKRKPKRANIKIKRKKPKRKTRRRKR